MIQSAALIFPSTFLATYGWAVSLGHADKIWPYISDTGDDDDGDDGDDDDGDGEDGDDDFKLEEDQTAREIRLLLRNNSCSSSLSH